MSVLLFVRQISTLMSMIKIMAGLYHGKINRTTRRRPEFNCLIKSVITFSAVTLCFWLTYKYVLKGKKWITWYVRWNYAIIVKIYKMEFCFTGTAFVRRNFSSFWEFDCLCVYMWEGLNLQQYWLYLWWPLTDSFNSTESHWKVQQLSYPHLQI